jgi:alpha-tubulin suppressor-like RCC1 family protein
VDVVGLSSGVVALSAGGLHTCALTTAGGVLCWGYNRDGQLGDGGGGVACGGFEEVCRLTPTPVSGLGSGVAALSAGAVHTCALPASGGVKCWGSNGGGQLGDGTQDSRLTPVDVSGLSSGVIALSDAAGHTCALTASGGVKCWGINYFGQLGDGGGGITCHPDLDRFCRVTPVDVVGLSSGVVALSAGDYHTCALTTAGGVLCWGWNWHGQLGDGGGGVACGGFKKEVCRLTPTPVSGLGSGVTALSARLYHTCALTPSSGVKCWGSNWYGQLGDGTRTDRPTPVDVIWP